MNFVVSDYYKTSPIALDYPEPEIVQGLSGRASHMTFRNMLLVWYSSYFGYPVPYYYVAKRKQPLSHTLINLP